MKNEVFNKLAKQETDRMLDVMCKKSSDYAKDDDKLFNFKQAGQVDNITSIEALRGMWLKHRASIQQGLDELLAGKEPRPREWWIEKLTDDRNYNLLLFAQLEEEYFLQDGTSPGYGSKEDDLIDQIFGPGIPAVWAVQFVAEDNEPEEFEGFTITKSCNDREWFIRLKDAEPSKSRHPRHLYRDLKLRKWLGLGSDGHGQSYYKTKDEARDTIKAYLNKTEELEEFTIQKAQDPTKGWYTILTKYVGKGYVGSVKFLHKDLELHSQTGWHPIYKYGTAPGYYKTKDEARNTIRAYKNKPVFEIAFYDKHNHGWYISVKNNAMKYLRDDLKIHSGTGFLERYPINKHKSFGYYPTKEIAEAYLKAYKEKNKSA